MDPGTGITLSGAILNGVVWDVLAAAGVPAALAAYDSQRRPATAEIVRSNRVGGPERVVDLVTSHTPDSSASVPDLATQADLAGIVRTCAQMAGFAVAV